MTTGYTQTLRLKDAVKQAIETIKTGREVNGMLEIYVPLQSCDLLLKSANDEIRNGTAIQNTKKISL